MIYLQSVDYFDQLAELDTNTGQISLFLRHERPAALSQQIRGAFAQLQGRILCLYRQAGLLHFRVDNEDFELTENTEVKLEHVEDDFNRITVLRDGVSLFTWTYQSPIVYPSLEIDPTPFVEEEDFDFCLFVYKVAKDPARKENIYTRSCTFADLGE